jgi:outer membrane protein assembly factor BamB/tetratricopeptide (TPR) repeat protein
MAVHPPRCRSAWSPAERSAAWCIVVAVALAGNAWAQAPQPLTLSDSVTLDEADAQARSALQRATAHAALQQWDEAIAALQRIVEEQPERLIEVPEPRWEHLPHVPRRFVPLADHAQWLLSALPPEALRVYRRRVDTQAGQQYQRAVARRDLRALERLLQRYFCSSWGDDALLALGELRLEQGDFDGARDCFRRLLPLGPFFGLLPSNAWETGWGAVTQTAYERIRGHEALSDEDRALLQRWYEPDATSHPTTYYLRSDVPLPAETAQRLARFWKQQGYDTRLTYPDTPLEPAAIAARLVLVSILQQDRARAQQEWAAFQHRFGTATGSLGGGQVNFAAWLRSLLEQSASWPAAEPPSDWPTFGGSPQRQRSIPGTPRLGALVWSVPLPRQAAHAALPRSRAWRHDRPGEDSQWLLSYHPIVVGDLVLWCTAERVFALNVHTGKPAWPGVQTPEAPATLPGEIFPAAGSVQPMPAPEPHLGAARYTLTAHGHRVFARLGSPITQPRSSAVAPPDAGYVLGLDLSAQGRALFRLEPDDATWSFEGTPLCEGRYLYVAMRRLGLRPQAYVACYDTDMLPPRLVWRRMICAADSPGRGELAEATHHLLTLSGSTLYYNTNLGAVASLDALDGRLRWVAVYPRAARRNPWLPGYRPAHYYRDTNPCVYVGGMVFAAPADNPHVFAWDASSGHLLWNTTSGLLPDDLTHLLGVASGYLVGTGDRLWMFESRSGRLVLRWPEGDPLGLGRGALLANHVLFPSASPAMNLYAIDAATGELAGDPVPLLYRQAASGNLVVTRHYVLIAGVDALYCFRRQDHPPAVAGN